MMPKGIVFDLDNTLLTSKLDFSAIRQSIGCQPGDDIIRFIDAIGCPDKKQEAMEKVVAFEMQDARDSSWLPGARETISFLHQCDLPMAIVTRNCRDAALLKMRSNQVPIDLVLSREDAEAKPSPQALLLVAETWNIEPGFLSYVGDYKYDVQAANRAGMHSVLLASTAAGCTPDYADTADLVVNDWHGYLAHLQALAGA